MATYDVATGSSQATVNSIISQLFNVLQPSGLFKGHQPVGEVDIDSVDFEITQAPTVDFQSAASAEASSLPQNLIKQLQRAISEDQMFAHLDKDKKAAVVKQVIAFLSQVALTINVPAVTITINYTPSAQSSPSPTIIQGSVSVSGMVSVDAGSQPPVVKVQAVSGTIITTDPVDPLVDQILNDSIVRYIIDVLNQKVFGPIAIPTIDFKGLTIATPELAVQDGFLILYSKLGTIPPTLPAPFPNWPATGIFVSLDAAIIKAAANIAIPLIPAPSASFSFADWTGSYILHLGNVSLVAVKNDGSGRLTATIDVSAVVNLTLHTPWFLPNISISPGASGSITATGQAAVTGSELNVTIVDVDHVDLQIEWPDVPGWVSDIIDALLGPIQNFLINNIFRPIINKLFGNFTFGIYNIPPIHVPLGPGVTITVASVQTQELNPTGGNALLVAHGTPFISSP